MNIQFQFKDLIVSGTLNDSRTALAIFDHLPIESKVSRWGDEIYFEISNKLPAENATLDVQMGDIAYWLEGSCLCLFFGRTPVSVDNRPRPASEVNLVGNFTAAPEALRKVGSGTNVQVLKA